MRANYGLEEIEAQKIITVLGLLTCDAIDLVHGHFNYGHCNFSKETLSVMRRSNRNLNIPPPPPGKPRAFDYPLCPGCGEFDLCLRGVGKIEPEVSGFK